MRKYGGELIYQAEGPFGHIEVVEDLHTRSLHFGDAVRQSSQLLIQPAVLVLSYTRYMMSGLLFVEAPRRVLLVGLGAGSIAQFLLFHYPDCQVQAVEPRADVINVARRYFSLPDSPRLQVHETDGVSFLGNLDSTAAHFDLVVIDAYNRLGIEHSVTNGDFFKQVKPILGPRGVLVVNLSKLEKPHYRSALKDLRQTFRRRTLRLPVLEKANEITLSLAPGDALNTSRPLLAERAGLLEQRQGIEYTEFLRVLLRDNRDTLSA